MKLDARQVLCTIDRVFKPMSHPKSALAALFLFVASYVASAASAEPVSRLLVLQTGGYNENGNPFRLTQVRPDTGAVVSTVVATVAAGSYIEQIAFSSDGSLFGIEEVGDQFFSHEGYLVKLNTTTGTVARML